MKLIGITSALGSTQTYQNTAYVTAFTRPGVTPLLIPQLVVKNRELLTRDSFMTMFVDQIAEYAARLDGLCISGGADLNPIAFDEINYQSTNVDITRDYMELALIEAFINAEKPIMGICRGHQAVGMYLGLPFFQQDLASTNENHQLAGDKVHRQEPCHQVYIHGGYREYLENATKQDNLRTINCNSHHHQGFTLTYDGKLPKHVKSRDFTAWYINRLSEYELEKDKCNGKIEILATTPLVIEAFRHRTLPIFCTQAHPEEHGSEGLTIQYWLDTMVK